MLVVLTIVAIVIVFIIVFTIWMVHNEWCWLGVKALPLDKTKKHDIVVSVFKENMAWLELLPPDLKKKVFVKDVASKLHGCSFLPNVGRCDHTYLYYIVHNYHALPDITVFVTGSTYAVRYKRFVLFHVIIPRLGSFFRCLGRSFPVSPNFSLSHYRARHPNNRTLNPLILSEDRPMKKWWSKRFPGLSFPKRFVHGGVFATTREAIQSVDLEVWRSLLNEMTTGDNLEAGHYMERSWNQLLTCGYRR